MSLSYSDCSILGGPLDPGVVKQLNLRKNVVSKTNSRRPQDIQYLNGVTGWVKATSSVDRSEVKLVSFSGTFTSTTTANSQKTSSTTTTIYNTKVDSTNAKNFKLEGGTSQSTRGFDPQVGFLLGNENSSYKTSTEYGFIPAPGITSFAVQSQNLYGTLRTATLTFTVHSPEDFSIMEELYLRPGMSILLEWGHSLYLRNDSTSQIEPDLESNIQTFSTEYFSKMAQQDIEAQIKSFKGQSENKVGNSYNYDAMFGFIRNFSWEYNGVNFICQVDVVSKGEILQSIRSTFAPLAEKKTNRDSKSYSPSTYASDLERFLGGILSGVTPHSKTSPFVISNVGSIDYLKENSPAILDSVLAKHGELNLEFNVISGAQSKGRGRNSTSWVKYISLRSLLILFNEVSLIYLDDKSPIVKFNVGSTGKCSKFTTFNDHIGIDPNVCILPKAKGVEKVAELFYKGSTVVSVDEESSKDILNILISVDLVLEIVSKRKNLTTDEDNTLYDVLSDILKEVESNLGFINQFDIHFDEDESTFFIIDRSVVPPGTDLPVIDVVGLNTEVENLSIVSKLSNNLTSAIAIAAQVGYSPSADVDLFNMQKWHEGLQDRHFPVKIVGKSFIKDQDDKKVSDELKNTLKQFLDPTNKAKEDSSTYNVDSSGLKDIHRQLMNEYVRKETEEKGFNPPGLIPLELSLSMKGISGLKIGQGFRIPDFFLPDRYKGKVGFLITGIDHKVQQGRWTTDLKSQMFIINGTT